MAEEHDLPDDGPQTTPPTPPPPAKKAPAKAVSKAPAKKAPAKKAPAKKAPVKKAPAKKAPTALANTNGAQPDGAREAAAQAKSTIEHAGDSMSAPALVPVPDRRPAVLPIAVAVVVSLLAILLIRQLRRGEHESGPRG